MSISELIRSMAAAGASAEAIALAVEAIEARDATIEARRLADRERKRRQRSGQSRDSHGTVTGHSCDGHGTVTGQSRDSSPLKEKSPPIPPSKENNPSQIVSSLRSETIARNRAFAQDVQKKFERFYEVYPKRTNRKAATLRFCAAVKSGVDAGHIVLAAERFAEAHRLAGTDKQFIPAPDVWLNKGRYDDEDLPAPIANARGSPAREETSGVAKLLAEAYGIDRRNGTETAGNLADIRALSVTHERVGTADYGDDGGLSGRLPRLE